jgi:hypothetical protein
MSGTAAVSIKPFMGSLPVDTADQSELGAHVPQINFTAE